MFDVIIFDFDGTLSNNDHRTHLVPGKGNDDSADWDAFSLACEHDTAYEDICKLARAMLTMCNNLYIFSGRGAIARDVSEKWLRDNEIYYDEFFMREVGDYRDDREIKKQWFLKLGLEQREVMIFDDRDKVVEMWRTLGVRCLQVQPGKF